MFSVKTKLNFLKYSKKFSDNLYNFKSFKFTSNALNVPSLNSIEFILPSLQKKEVQLNETTTFRDVESVVKDRNRNHSVEFRTWDNSIISKSNQVNTVLASGDPIFMKIEKMEWQILNTKNIDLTMPETENIKVKEEFSHNAYLDLQEIKKKLEALNNNKDLSNEELHQIALQIYKIKDYYNNTDLKSSQSNFKNLEEIFKNYYNLKSEYTKLHTLKESLLKKCEIKAKILLLLAGLLFVLELILLYYGTFIKYSWDITEPITYLAGCCNVILVLYYRRKIGSLSAFEFYTNKFFKRLVKRKKFNENHFEEVGKKLKEIENILNK